MARVRAPELLGSGGWIGAAADLGLSALAGKVVVLHFWRASSVHCVRVLEELRPIEERFAAEVVVVGIHSPKFPHEHEHAAVERAVERLGIRHAVLDDPDLATWQQYGVKGWPTLVVIDPEGYVVGGISGEGGGGVVYGAVEQTVVDHDGRGTLVRGGVPGIWASTPVTAGLRTVSFPGKVALDAAGRRLAISDSGNGRILVCDLSGRVEQVYPLFTRPQGVAFDGDRLLVCDTGTDRVVAVDRTSGIQTVLAGGLASPWD
ncbi:MAG TPA: redoxin domain-containing protein, partial [Acidimicrobiales bacterium]